MGWGPFAGVNTSTPGRAFQAAHRLRRQLPLPAGDGLRRPSADEPQSLQQPGDARHIVGAGLQTIRQGRGHLPVTGGASRAAQQQRPGGPFAAQQQPRPLGAVKPLVARHGNEGRPQLRQVQGQRPCRLGGVHQQRHTPAAADSGDLLQRLDAAEHVGHMVDDHRIRPGQNGPSEFSAACSRRKGGASTTVRRTSGMAYRGRQTALCS